MLIAAHRNTPPPKEEEEEEKEEQEHQADDRRVDAVGRLAGQFGVARVAAVDQHGDGVADIGRGRSVGCVDGGADVAEHWG